MFKNRTIKIHALSRRKEGSPATYSFVPSIVLSGKWVQDAGFCISDHVLVTVDKEKIIITKE